MDYLEHLLDLQAKALVGNDLEEATVIERELDKLGETPNSYSLPLQYWPLEMSCDQDYDYDSRDEEYLYHDNI